MKICTNIEYCYKNLKTKAKVLFIYCDDMIYSEYGKAKKLIEYLPKYDPLRNADIYLGVPYISITGLDNLKKKFPVKLFNSTTPIASLKDLFVNKVKKSNSDNDKKEILDEEKILYDDEKEILDEEKILYDNEKEILDTENPLLRLYNKFCNIIERNKLIDYTDENALSSFQCNQNMTPIYFDHGIADSKFTFRKLLYFGTYPTIEQEECNYVNLINNCEMEERFNLYSERNNLCNLEDDIDNNIFSSNDPKDNTKIDYTTVLMGDIHDKHDKRNKCPKNFYETIKYRYYQENKKPLDLPEGLESMKEFTIITVPVILKNRKKELNKSKMEHIKEWFYNILKKYLKYLKYKSKYFKLKQALR